MREFAINSYFYKSRFMKRACKEEFCTKRNDNSELSQTLKLPRVASGRFKDNYLQMKRRITGRFLVGLLLTGLVITLAQSCNASKRCGCGTDINGVYKHRRR